MIARLLLLLALLLPGPAAAQSLAGSWALQMGGATIFRFDLAHDADGHWHGTWSKPGSFASDGNHFRKLSGPVKEVRSMTAVDLPDGIELSFNDPTPGAIPDIFDFRLTDPDTVKMTYVGTGLAPYTLKRVAADAPLGPWDPVKIYGRETEAKEADKPDAEALPPADTDSFSLPAGAATGR